MNVDKTNKTFTFSFKSATTNPSKTTNHPLTCRPLTLPSAPQSPAAAASTPAAAVSEMNANTETSFFR
jgi:hypothetical protein